MEMDNKLNAVEEESRKFQEEKVNLEYTIKVLWKNQNKLLSKIKESQEFIDVCVKFLKKNGIMSTSFMSDELPL